MILIILAVLRVSEEQKEGPGYRTVPDKHLSAKHWPPTPGWSDQEPRVSGSHGLRCLGRRNPKVCRLSALCPLTRLTPGLKDTYSLQQPAEETWREVKDYLKKDWALSWQTDLAKRFDTECHNCSWKNCHQYCRGFAVKHVLVLLLKLVLKHVPCLLLRTATVTHVLCLHRGIGQPGISVNNGSPLTGWKRGLLQGKALATSFGDSPDI